MVRTLYTAECRNPIKSSDGFEQSTINLSDNPEASTSPAIAVSRNNIHVVWEETTASETMEVLYKKSTNGGATFGSTINLSNNPGTSYRPSITVFGNNVYEVWQDTTPGNDDIF